MMTRIVKIGGNVVDNPALLADFVKQFAALEGPKVLIHGGGVMASKMQRELDIAPIMVAGRRVTDEAALRVVTMVYAGWCGKQIAALLQAEGCNAMSLSGCDGGVISAARRAPLDGVDYGFVGDVTAESVDAALIAHLIERGITPVFNAINHDTHGQLLNTNADTIASSVAQALAVHGLDTQLIYCFEKPGVLLDKDDDTSVIPILTPKSYAQLKAEGRVADGMIPKLDNAFAAISAGVSSVVIKHAKDLAQNAGSVLMN